MAAVLPLSADEAYYWLWSRHLAAGYFDHPPDDRLADPRRHAAVRRHAAGRARWRAWCCRCPPAGLSGARAALILKDEDRAALAALFFNLTLMVSVELLAATPDMPSIVTSARLCLVPGAGAGTRATARWWLAAGVAAGLGLLSKYLRSVPGRGRVGLAAGGSRCAQMAGIALAVSGRACWRWLIFAPNLLWQSQHHWETFAFQFGRVGAGHFTLRYLGEFLGAQFGLASPLIFVLMAAGPVARARRRDSDRLMLALLAWSALGYFLEHALHDRVQGNWPCFSIRRWRSWRPTRSPAAAWLAQAFHDRRARWRR